MTYGVIIIILFCFAVSIGLGVMALDLIRRFSFKESKFYVVPMFIWSAIFLACGCVLLILGG